MANPNVTKWIPPLPPGWEGRWDANQRAYFFIDHATKKTTWQDPRFNQKVTNQPAFPPQKNLYENRALSGISPEPTFVVDDNMAENIHQDYPRVPLDTIKDIVSACNFDEQESRVMLTRMGYQKGATESPHRTNDSLPKPKSAAKGKAKAKSPSRSPARSPSPAPTPTPSPPVSEAEKKRIVSQLKSEFPDLNSVVVTMALDVCEYKESQARMVLKGWGETKDAENKAQTRPMSSRASTPSASTSLEPVVFDYDERPSPVRNTARKSTNPTSTKSVVTSHQGQKRNKKPTHVTQHTRPRQQVITHQPRTDSTYRTQTNGPNSDLRMGPDKSLLLSEYTLVHGPNLTNRQGPDRSRVVGAQGATGPDPANRCGPESLGINDLQTSRQQYLVTSI
ncbi:E3 ubiquitin-protein ligase Smurf1-like isoform X2 [Pecten maximus]|uniref:E3 ubiquitin-protein ligase Smurf1-like isoform X2 n=1 Tax=Pecten maximus TaxID=6579 RepID=UPI001459148D|nr:E3 ubiquitin-protein ligase Smurf1-like isoform X2 [Pecten maximus]